jgi:hypothetical protein
MHRSARAQMQTDTRTKTVILASAATQTDAPAAGDAVRRLHRKHNMVLSLCPLTYQSNKWPVFFSVYCCVAEKPAVQLSWHSPLVQPGHLRGRDRGPGLYKWTITGAHAAGLNKLQCHSHPSLPHFLPYTHRESFKRSSERAGVHGGKAGGRRR